MERQEKITILTSVVVVLSLIGILVLQASWLNLAVDTNIEIFQQKVDIASNKIAKIIRDKKGLTDKIHQTIINNKGESNFVNQEIKSVIKEVLDEANLPNGHSYGLYKHINQMDNQKVYGNASDTLLKNSTCNKKSDRFFGWTNLTCNQNYGNGNDYHLAIFPSYESYIFNEVKWILTTSILFIGLVLIGFIYTIKTIRKQTKLSVLKNDFINNLTHEFKTPLFSISLASKAIRKKEAVKNSEGKTSYLDVIDTETNHLKNQVEKILQLSMLDSGRLFLTKERIFLHEHLKEVSNNFDLLLKEKNGIIHFDLDNSNPRIYGDIQHLKNVWYNILDNAIKYNNNSPVVKLSTRICDDDIIEILVKDNGIGIKSENRDLVFDRFYREREGDIYNAKGFGLGLSYVSEILKLHNANISLMENTTSGSTFKISFPRYYE
ncbi:sensor histidine kinase [Psychroserpens algicola]|uniref:histidine kinase n=1 Tax=Psychroserpens algicola TaxID=1719034 RepID=A0ABT0H5X8_9FLAO|nr:HAMP domain-containing sensor histidine kinase [Psychroserpens algicola]MCK8479789.1 HAMP domain-containing histidine kinase [Psychroserpens algicola]